MPSISVDHSLCVKDQHCVTVCPVANIFMGKDGFPTSGDRCIRCGHCQAVCPTDALTLHGIPPLDLEPSDIHGVGYEGLAKLVKSRRSIREFKDEPVAAPLVEEILDTVRWAPTGGNTQWVRWVLIDKKEDLREVSRLVVEWSKSRPEFANLVEAYEGGFDTVLRGAPQLLLNHAGTEYGSTRADCLIAMTTFELLAVSRGLGTCWAGFVLMAAGDPASPLRGFLGIPKDHYLNAGLMIGHPKLKYRRIPQRNPISIRHL